MRIRILTLNAWGLPWPAARDTDARMRAIGRRLAEFDADVAAFQEVWTQSTREALVSAGRSAGYAHTWHRGGFLGRGGLLVLSRLPFRAARFTRFALCGLPQNVAHADYYAGKGFAHLTLETPAGPVALLTTHLIPHYGKSGSSDAYLGHRVAQIVQLSAALAHVEEPAVTVGDFNLTESEPEYRILCGLAGLTDLAAALEWREVTTLSGPPYRSGDRLPGARLDYVFARGGRGGAARPVGIARVLDEPWLVEGHSETYSDHAGLVGEIEIGEGPEPPLHPDPEAVDLAETFLREGRRQAMRRRGEQLRSAGMGGVVSIAALGAAHRLRLSRRRLLRASLLGLPALALAASAGGAALVDGFASDELEGYDRVDALLAELAGNGRGRRTSGRAREEPSRSAR